MENGFAQLCGTVGVHAAVVGLSGRANDVAAAYRTSLGHLKFQCSAGMIFVIHHADDFRDDVAAALDLDPIANFHPQALDLVHVVERSAADRGAADGNGFQHRHRSEFSGTAHLHDNIFNLRDSSAGGVLVGDGPARCFAGVAEFLLDGAVIDFDHDAVDLVG